MLKGILFSYVAYPSMDKIAPILLDLLLQFCSKFGMDQKNCMSRRKKIKKISAYRILLHRSITRKTGHLWHTHDWLECLALTKKDLSWFLLVDLPSAYRRMMKGKVLFHFIFSPVEPHFQVMRERSAISVDFWKKMKKCHIESLHSYLFSRLELNTGKLKKRKISIFIPKCIL